LRRGNDNDSKVSDYADDGNDTDDAEHDDDDNNDDSNGSQRTSQANCETNVSPDDA